MGMIPTRTRGELEAEISQAIIRFERELMGRGPTEARAYLIDDVALVRLKGTLTVVERSLAERPDEGPRLVRQLRQELLACKRPLLEELVKSLLGVRLRSVYTDVSTTTGEGLLVMTFESAPSLPEAREGQTIQPGCAGPS